MGRKERFYVDIMAVNPEVTGSCKPNVVTLPNPNLPKIRFLVDCGLFQEKDYEELNNSFPFKPENIDFCLITHNHIDHIGRLPLLIKKGFRGKIYTTYPTSNLISLALWDSHKILKESSKRKHNNSQQLYQSINVEQTLDKVVACNYNEEIQINDYIKVTFLTNGHLIGASLIYVNITYPGFKDINLLYTGDYKGSNIFFEVDLIPEKLKKIPMTIIQESTYGYMNSEEIQPCFEKNVIEQLQKEKTVIVPVFALGRSQEILYLLKQMQQKGQINTSIPIYLDGKLAQQYTSMFIKKDLGLKEEMKDFLPQNLDFVNKVSRELVVRSSKPKIILTTSGMCSYGPAQTYLANYISNPKAFIHFTGYLAEGTLGAKLKNTPSGEEVMIGGVNRRRFASIEYTTEYSAHAKADEIIDFLNQFEDLKVVLIDHGEAKVKEQFVRRIFKEINPKDVEILGNQYVYRIGSYGLIKTMPTKFL